MGCGFGEGGGGGGVKADSRIIFYFLEYLLHLNYIRTHGQLLISGRGSSSQTLKLLISLSKLFRPQKIKFETFFYIRGYFKISVFETAKLDCNCVL